MTSKEVDDKSFQQIQVLNALVELLKTQTSSTSTLQIAETLGLQHDKIVGIIKSLESRNKVNISEPREQSTWYLTDEGQSYAKEGTPESRVFNCVKAAGKTLPIADLKSNNCGQMTDAALDIGMKNALKLKWLSIEKSTKSLVCAVDQVNDVVHSILKTFGDQERGEEELLKSIGEKDGLGQLQV